MNLMRFSNWPMSTAGREITNSTNKDKQVDIKIFSTSQPKVPSTQSISIFGHCTALERDYSFSLSWNYHICSQRALKLLQSLLSFLLAVLPKMVKSSPICTNAYALLALFHANDIINLNM